jgi:hypothetical protein
MFLIAVVGAVALGTSNIPPPSAPHSDRPATVSEPAIPRSPTSTYPRSPSDVHSTMPRVDVRAPALLQMNAMRFESLRMVPGWDGYGAFGAMPAAQQCLYEQQYIPYYAYQYAFQPVAQYCPSYAADPFSYGTIETFGDLQTLGQSLSPWHRLGDQDPPSLYF